MKKQKKKYERPSSIMKIIGPAKNTTGILLRIINSNKEKESSIPVLRVYKNSKKYRREQMQRKLNKQRYDKSAWEYIDYDITHYDLEVKVTDTYATLYEGKGKNKRKILDYPPISPETMKVIDKKMANLRKKKVL